MAAKPELKVAMQTTCVHCNSEQYAQAVFDVSHGRAGCSFCGEMSEPMDQATYEAKLRELRKKLRSS